MEDTVEFSTFLVVNGPRRVKRPTTGLVLRDKHLRHTIR